MDGAKMGFSGSALQSIGAAATTAVLVGLTVPFLRTDFISRHFLSAEQLQKRRRKEYEFRWSFLFEKLLVSTLDELDNDKYLVVLVQEQEIQEFIEKKCVAKGERPKVVFIGVDEKLKTREVCVWVLLPSDGVVYRAPLRQFGLKLHAVMESQLTSRAMCFITEASGGLGSKVIGSILEQSDLQVPVVREPQWMVMFAKIVDEGRISRETLEKCLFGLVRLEALSSAQLKDKAKTVCFTVPGQGVSAVMMPILQSVFPCERHVFVYDGCRNVVGRSLTTRKSGDQPKPFGYQCVSVAIHTTPMAQHLPKRIRNLPQALAKLPLNLADTLEAWMTSVDSFLKMKEDENTNEYLPFVCKMNFLLVEGNDQGLALQNLLQFITGARSRPLPEGAVQKAMKVLKSIKIVEPPAFFASLHRAIEECVFHHKGILIGDKTLLDTVLPQRDWTLKAAKKISGCACCGPEDEDEDEDEFNPSIGGATTVDGIDVSRPGPFTQVFDADEGSEAEPSRKKNRPRTYVDGKTTFAFDPTKFS